MNQKIKDIVSQAKTDTELYGGKPGDKDFDERFQKKFAELILKDAFAIIHQSCIGGEKETQIGEIIDDRLQDAASDVVDAYGIEERIY